MLADRVSRIKPSGIRRIFDLMATMEDPINLSIGQAHYDAPEALKEAACEAIRSGLNKYTVTQGLPELNERIIAAVRQRHGGNPEACLVTSGVSGGLLLAYLVLLDPGDEILLPDPNFTMYRVLAELCGATIRYYDLYPSFHPDPAQIDELITDKTRIILVNSPSNPTGAVLTREEIRAIAVSADRVGACLLSDEIYDHFVYTDDYASPVSYGERVIQLGGFSKTFGVPGWRMGYATGPAEVLDAMKTLQQFTFVCAPAPFQHAVLQTAFDMDMGEYEEDYRRRRDRLMAGLNSSYQLSPPEGSFYAFPSLPGVDGTAVVEAALEERLLLVPGKAFSRVDSHFRLSFSATDEDLDRGLAVLDRVANRLTS